MTGAGGTESADEVVRRCFAAERGGAESGRTARIDRAEADLLGCLDALAPCLLDRQGLALAALERQFDPRRAVAKVADADAVLLALPVFLDDPRWHGVDHVDRRLRIGLAETLVEVVLRSDPSVSSTRERAAWIVSAAVRHEIWLLRQERAALRGA